MLLAGNTFSFRWEVRLITWLQVHFDSAGASAASFFSFFGGELACVLVLGFFYWCWDKKLGRQLGLNLLAVNILCPMVKNVFLRRRPYFDLPEIACLDPVEPDAPLFDISTQGYSFPSGHSANAVAAYFPVALYLRKKKPLFVLFALLPLFVGVSQFWIVA